MKIRRNPGPRRVPRRLGLGHRVDESKRGPPPPDTEAGKRPNPADPSSGDDR